MVSFFMLLLLLLIYKNFKKNTLLIAIRRSINGFVRGISSVVDCVCFIHMQGFLGSWHIQGNLTQECNIIIAARILIIYTLFLLLMQCINLFPRGQHIFWIWSKNSSYYVRIQWSTFTWWLFDILLILR
jgi:hypothetical protein